MWSCSDTDLLVFPSPPPLAHPFVNPPNQPLLSIPFSPQASQHHPQQPLTVSLLPILPLESVLYTAARGIILKLQSAPGTLALKTSPWLSLHSEKGRGAHKALPNPHPPAHPLRAPGSYLSTRAAPSAAPCPAWTPFPQRLQGSLPHFAQNLLKSHRGAAFTERPLSLGPSPCLSFLGCLPGASHHQSWVDTRSLPRFSVLTF